MREQRILAFRVFNYYQISGNEHSVHFAGFIVVNAVHNVTYNAGGGRDDFLSEGVIIFIFRAVAFVRFAARIGFQNVESVALIRRVLMLILLNRIAAPSD